MYRESTKKWMAPDLQLDAYGYLVIGLLYLWKLGLFLITDLI